MQDKKKQEFDDSDWTYVIAEVSLRIKWKKWMRSIIIGQVYVFHHIFIFVTLIHYLSI